MNVNSAEGITSHDFASYPICVRRLACYKSGTFLRGTSWGNWLGTVVVHSPNQSQLWPAGASSCLMKQPCGLHYHVTSYRPDHASTTPRPDVLDHPNIFSLERLAECAAGDAQRSSSRTQKPRENFRVKRSLPPRCGGRDRSAEPWRGEIARIRDNLRHCSSFFQPTSF